MAKKVVAFILIIAALVTLAACANSEKTATSIQIVDGSVFKNLYMLGEQLSIEGAKFLITYSDGSTRIIDDGKDIIITGFNTDAPSENSQMTISYKGASVVLYYSVAVQVGLDTDFRLSMTASETNEGIDISILSTGVEKVPHGVYAISLTIKVREAVFVSLSSPLGIDWTVKHTRAGDTIKVLLYSTDGYTPLTTSGSVARLSVTKIQGNKPSSVTVSDIRISNGERDFIGIPSYSINL